MGGGGGGGGGGRVGGGGGGGGGWGWGGGECGMEDILDKLQPYLTSLARPRLSGSHEQTVQREAVGVVLDGAQEVLESSKGIEYGAGLLIGIYVVYNLNGVYTNRGLSLM